MSNLNERRIARLILIDGLIQEKRQIIKYCHLLIENEKSLAAKGWAIPEINTDSQGFIDKAVAALGGGFIDSIEDVIWTKILERLGLDPKGLLSEVLGNVLEQIPIIELYERLAGEDEAAKKITCNEVSEIIQKGISEGLFEYVMRAENQNKLIGMIADILGTKGTAAGKSLGGWLEGLIAGRTAAAAKTGGAATAKTIGINTFGETFTNFLNKLLDDVGFHGYVSNFICDLDWGTIGKSIIHGEQAYVEKLTEMRRNIL